jgi:hypothetical protein
METGNKEFIEYFDNLSNNIGKMSNFSEKLGEGFEVGKTKLSKTSKQARVNARILAAQMGETFDETGTPPDELSTIEQDTIDELVNRKINKLFGE